MRDTVEEDLAKRNPFDFGLWFTLSKFSNQAMKWDSPWGVGYPGWHIECSGISSQYLGEYLDIHCGGIDNIFPHHTNEIAQSEAYFGHKWCNYWIHGEHLNDQTGKMSKSKGEFLTLELLKSKGYSPLVYRYFCLGSHYRKTLTFSYDSLEVAKNSYQKLKNKVKSLKNEGEVQQAEMDSYEKKFGDAISNDLNTSQMLTILYDVLKSKDLSDRSKRVLVEKFDSVLSLSLLEEETDTTLDDYALSMIEKRKIAKENKNYEEADRIRDELLEKGIKLIDGREGTTYELLK